ncbi:MAG: discoidin domain-containing protein [Saccharofermentanales bacterium]
MKRIVQLFSIFLALFVLFSATLPAVSADELSGPQLTVADFSSDHANPGGNNDYGAVLSVDGNPDTFWSNDYSPKKLPPHHITIDLGSAVDVTGFKYLPRQDGYSGPENGNLGPYKIYTSTDNVNFTETHAGSFDSFSQLESTAIFSKAVSARYFKLWTEMEWIGVAELNILTGGGSSATPTAAPTPAGGYSVQTDKIIYEQGEDITVTFAGSLNPRYTIGICSEAAPQYQGHSIGVWLYAGSGTQTAGNGTKENGTVIFSASQFGPKLVPGEYAMYFITEDWHTQVAEAHFVVVEKGGDTTPPTKPDVPKSMTYERTATKSGYAAGTITITPPDSDKGLRGFELYWADETGKLASYTHIAYAAYESGSPVVYEIPAGVIYPPDAKRIIAYSKGWQSFISDDFVSADLNSADILSASKLLYSFQVITDIHLTTNSSHTHNIHFDAALKDILATDPESSGIFTVGDNTDQGAEEEWKLFKSAIDANLKGSGLPVYATMGNHEFIKTNKYDDSVSVFKQYTGAPAPYYSVEVGGTTFIMLATQSLDVASGFADIKEDQMTWLKSTLATASAKGGPVFVLLHQPLKETVSGSLASIDETIQDWFGVEQDAELRAILDQYPDVVLFSGHTHWQLDSRQPLLLSNGTTANYLNSASVGYLWTDEDTALTGSQGYFVEVYEDYVLVRGRDFVSKEWVSNARFMLDINSPASPDESGSDASTADGDGPGTPLWIIVLPIVAAAAIVIFIVTYIIKKKKA